jgi:chromate transporter
MNAAPKLDDALTDAALLFIGLSFLCIGGTIPLLPDMHRFFVESRGLMTSREFTSYIAFAQASPGPNILYVALLGYHIAGLKGALTTLGAMSLGPFLLILITSKLETRFRANPWREVVLTGLAPVTVGLLLAGTWTLTKSFATLKPWLLCAIALLIFMRVKLNPLWVIAAGACIGLVLEF